MKWNNIKKASYSILFFFILIFYLKMIFLLTHERVVRVAEIESFIRIHPIVGHWKFFQIMITENMPGCLLKGMKSDTLVTGVYVAIIRHFIAIENCTATTTTVFYSS